MATGTQYGTKQELIDAVKLLIFANNSYEVSATDVQTGFLDTIESVWDRLATISTNGIVTPIGNVTPSLLGETYINTAVSPNLAYVATGLTNTDWLVLNITASTGNGVEIGATGVASLGDFTENTAIAGNEKTYNRQGLLSFTERVFTIADPTTFTQLFMSPTAMNFSADGSGIHTEMGSSMGTTGVSRFEANGDISRIIAEREKVYMEHNDASNGNAKSSYQIDLVDGLVVLNGLNQKGIKNVDQSGLDWATDDDRLPNVATIKANLPTNFIKQHVSVASVVANPVIANVFVPYSINLSTDKSTRYGLTLSGVPSTSQYAYTYEVDIIAVASDTNKHVILDFTGNVGCPRIKLNGVFTKVLSQNAAYIISYDGTNLVYDKIREPKMLVTDQSAPTYPMGPGKWLVTGSFSSATIEDTANILEGEEIEIIASQDVDLSLTTFTASGSDSFSTGALNGGSNKINLVIKGTIWYKHN